MQNSNVEVNQEGVLAVTDKDTKALVGIARKDMSHPSRPWIFYRAEQMDEEEIKALITGPLPAIR